MCELTKKPLPLSSVDQTSPNERSDCGSNTPCSVFGKVGKKPYECAHCLHAKILLPRRAHVFSRVTISPIIITERERIPPPPRPWTVMTSYQHTHVLCSFTYKFPMANTAMELRNNGLRPKIWAGPPVIGRITVEVKACADPTHAKSSLCREAMMVGSAVNIGSKFQAGRNKAMHRVNILSQKRRCFRWR